MKFAYVRNAVAALSLLSAQASAARAAADDEMRVGASDGCVGRI